MFEDCICSSLKDDMNRLRLVIVKTATMKQVVEHESVLFPYKSMRKINLEMPHTSSLDNLGNSEIFDLIIFHSSLYFSPEGCTILQNVSDYMREVTEE